MHVHVKGGLNLQLDGSPDQVLLERVLSDRVALQLRDYRGMRPKLLVKTGDHVIAGQALLHDRGNPALVCTAPLAGTVQSIEFGARRHPTEVVLQVDGEQSVAFPSTDRNRIGKLTAAKLRDLLQKSGLWLALRARPFENIAASTVEPRALFITAIDSNPLAADPAVVIDARADEFVAGVRALAKLPSGDTWVCVAHGANIALPEGAGIRRAEFSGMHPAGLPGTHLNAVGPGVGREADLWHIGYQDVIAVGKLLLSGQIDAERVIAYAGPGIERPGLYRVRLGTELSALPLPRNDCAQQVIAGPLLGQARQAEFLGRFDLQVSVFPVDVRQAKGGGIWRNATRRLLAPRSAESLLPAGPARGGMLPVELFERVWPFRTPPAAVLRALLIGDPDDAIGLGCLGLAEEDLALCNLVCPAGQDYGDALRRTLERIELQQ